MFRPHSVLFTVYQNDRTLGENLNNHNATLELLRAYGMDCRQYFDAETNNIGIWCEVRNSSQASRIDLQLEHFNQLGYTIIDLVTGEKREYLFPVKHSYRTGSL